MASMDIDILVINTSRFRKVEKKKEKQNKRKKEKLGKNSLRQKETKAP